jgi:undecaprenyl-diphosphatase
MLDFYIFISNIADVKPMFIFITLISTFFYFTNKKYLSFLLISSALLSIAITTGLKLLFKIPRPENALIYMNDFRFPSGHATMAATISGFFIYIIYKSKIDNKIKVLLYAVSFFWFCLVSYSRLYLQVHYIIDVMVGGIIGYFTIYFLIKHLNKKEFEIKF